MATDGKVAKLDGKNNHEGGDELTGKPEAYQPKTYLMLLKLFEPDCSWGFLENSPEAKPAWTFVVLWCLCKTFNKIGFVGVVWGCEYFGMSQNLLH